MSVTWEDYGRWAPAAPWRSRVCTAKGSDILRTATGCMFPHRHETTVARIEDPDDELLGRVARGDAAAIQTMVARKLPRVLNLAARLLGDPVEAEDVAQEAMLRVWKQAGKWKPGQARFDTWLYRVSINLCYDRLRRRRETPVETVPDMVDDGPAPDRGLLAAETGDRVQKVLMRLPERQREAIVLCHYQELGNIEAAQLMGISVEALESLLSRARRTLRAALGDLASRPRVNRRGN